MLHRTYTTSDVASGQPLTLLLLFSAPPKRLLEAIFQILSTTSLVDHPPPLIRLTIIL